MLNNGENHTATKAAAGQTDSWTFTATLGDALLVAIGEVSGSATFTPWIRLVAPNGTTIGNNWNAAAAQIEVPAPATGTYTVLDASADAGNLGTGDSPLTLAKAPGAFVVSPGDHGGRRALSACVYPRYQTTAAPRTRPNDAAALPSRTAISSKPVDPLIATGAPGATSA